MHHTTSITVSMCVYAVLNIRESSLIIIITTIGGRPTKCELVTRSRCISRQSHNSTVRGGQNYRVCFHKILKTLYRLTLSHSTCVLDAINDSYKIHTYIYGVLLYLHLLLYILVNTLFYKLRNSSQSICTFIEHIAITSINKIFCRQSKVFCMKFCVAQQNFMVTIVCPTLWNL